MGVIWQKVWHDLWHNKVRTALVVVSVATGVFSVGAIFGMNDQLKSSMNAAHQATIPSHVVMYPTELIDEDTARALENIPGVSGVELVNIINTRWKKQPQDEWSNGSLLMRPDYEDQLYDQLQLRAGEWPQGDNLGIERMHGPFYGIDIGDQVILEVGDKERTFTITGRIRHPFVPPPSMYDLAWFFADSPTLERFGIPEGRFNRLQILVQPYSPELAREVGTEVKLRLERQGIGIAATQYQDPLEHWGRPFIDGMSVVLQVLAIISLLLSAVLVLNTLTAIITQQTNQIGILKAVGARRGTIVRAYLAVVLVYGVLSLGVALPLGMTSAYGVTRWMLGLFNIDYDTFAFSRQAVTLQVVAALVVPLVAALAPVLQGAAITVRQAIATYGLGADFGSAWFDRLIERVALRLLPPRYAMVVSNIFRRKGRLLLSQFVLVTAGVMFLMIMSLSSSIHATIVSEFERRTHDVILQFNRDQRIDVASRFSRSVPGVTHADMWISLPVTILREGQRVEQAGMGSEIDGVPLEDPMYAPLIVAGRWLRPGDTRVVVMNRDTAEDEHILVGDTVTLDLGAWGKYDWKVVGLYKTFVMFGGGFSLDAIYTPRQALLDVMHRGQRGSLMFVRTDRHSAADTETIANELSDMFGARNMEVAGTATVQQLRTTTQSSFDITLNMLMVLAVIVGLVGGIGLMGSLSISVVERTKEIGVLRAIGGRSWTIMGMFVLEGVIQGMLAWLVAVPVAFATSPFLSDALSMTMFNTRMNYAFNTEAVWMWLGLTVVIATLASIVPARSATRISVRQSLVYE
jgi:putative ABC transport system permease protein